MSAAKGLALTALQQNIPANVRLGWRVQLIAELLIPRKRLGPLKGCLAVNRIRI